MSGLLSANKSLFIFSPLIACTFYAYLPFVIAFHLESIKRKNTNFVFVRHCDIVDSLRCYLTALSVLNIIGISSL